MTTIQKFKKNHCSMPTEEFPVCLNNKMEVVKGHESIALAIFRKEPTVLCIGSKKARHSIKYDQKWLEGKLTKGELATFQSLVDKNLSEHNNPPGPQSSP